MIKRRRMSSTGYVGLLVALVGALYFLNAAPAVRPAQAQQKKPAKPLPPTEQIDVEEAVSFPYDI